MENSIVKLQEETDLELTDTKTQKLLLGTTFKGLSLQNMAAAIMEGKIRGFTIQNFLERDVYAIPFGQGYSLVTSIDYARKIGMRSSIVGKTAPVFKEKDGRIISCTVTVKRLIGGVVGDFTATVYFAEYTTGKNQWVTKPRTMIAKVAEMHALRMACPEEMSQVYVEEEKEQEVLGKIQSIDINVYENKLKESKTLADLSREWSALPFEAKQKLGALKDEIKAKFQ